MNIESIYFRWFRSVSCVKRINSEYFQLSVSKLAFFRLRHLLLKLFSHRLTPNTLSTRKHRIAISRTSCSCQWFSLTSRTSSSLDNRLRPAGFHLVAFILDTRQNLMNVSHRWNEVIWNDVATQLNNVNEFQRTAEKFACFVVANTVSFICMHLPTQHAYFILCSRSTVKSTRLRRIKIIWWNYASAMGCTRTCCLWMCDGECWNCN